jgi:hypothetical protein
MSGDLTSKEQAMFAEDTQEMKLPVYTTPEGDKIVVNPGSKVPSTAKKVAGRRKTKKGKRHSKKRSLLKSRKVR